MIGRKIRNQLIPGMATPMDIYTIDYVLYYTLVKHFGGVIEMAGCVGLALGSGLHEAQFFRGLEDTIADD
jgi:hypothetical protein